MPSAKTACASAGKAVSGGVRPSSRVLSAMSDGVRPSSDLLSAITGRAIGSDPTAPKPASKPRRLASTAFPSARMAARKASAGIGSTPLTAMAPSSTALSGLFCCAAIPAKSAMRARREKRSARPSMRSWSSRPSPMAAFSSTVNTRADEAMSTVRSGVTYPAPIALVDSSSSLATTMSTSPGAALSASTGRTPDLRWRSPASGTSSR